MNTELFLKVEKARTRMVLSLPFIASAVMMLRLEEDNRIPTAETDGDFIYYNEEFFKSLTLRQLMWVLAHEALHCVLLHHIREGNRDHTLWNMAADYVINLILHDIRDFEFVPDCLLDFSYLLKSTEEVYNILKQLDKAKQEQLKKNYKDVAGFRKPISTGESDKGSGVKTPSEFGSQEEKWQIFAKQAIDVVKKMTGDLQGFGSAALDRLINSIVNPVVNWSVYLHIFVDQISKEDYNWNKFNPRYLSYGYYFPTLYSEKMGYIVVVVDTSGSISQNDLDRFAAEVNSIKITYNCKILVIYCDAKITNIEIFDEYEDVKLRPSGGGGTSFRPPFEYIENNVFEEDEIKCLLYFTDGCCDSYPDNIPEFPVLWVGMRTFVPKFGEFIFMEAI